MSSNVRYIYSNTLNGVSKVSNFTKGGISSSALTWMQWVGTLRSTAPLSSSAAPVQAASNGSVAYRINFTGSPKFPLGLSVANGHRKTASLVVPSPLAHDALDHLRSFKSTFSHSPSFLTGNFMSHYSNFDQ